ncbi:MAG: hypothetical protein PHQ40_20540 [Anaerolineaceae bacterium]|nr:hypothetical protein [Anaerolineaceae bacterium]
MTEDMKLELRKRGAQPGNTNAYKHGFYSRWFRELELAELEKVPLRGVQDEIDMLRVLMRRLFELATSGSPELDTVSKALTTLGKASYHLGALLKVQADGNQQGDEVATAFSEALNQVIQELHL